MENKGITIFDVDILLLMMISQQPLIDPVTLLMVASTREMMKQVTPTVSTVEESDSDSDCKKIFQNFQVQVMAVLAQRVQCSKTMLVLFLVFARKVSPLTKTLEISVLQRRASKQEEQCKKEYLLNRKHLKVLSLETGCERERKKQLPPQEIPISGGRKLPVSLGKCLCFA